ncbi:hypothetical protein [Paenirhodobacter sp.]
MTTPRTRRHMPSTHRFAGRTSGPTFSPGPVGVAKVVANTAGGC